MIKHISRISTGLASIAVILLSSCDSSRHKGFKETEDGLFYQFHRQDESGKAPQLKDILYAHMSLSLKGNYFIKNNGIKEMLLLLIDSFRVQNYVVFVVLKIKI